MGEQSYFHRKFLHNNEHHTRSKKLKKQNLSSSASRTSDDLMPPAAETHPKEVFSDLPSTITESQSGNAIDKVNSKQLIREPSSDLEKLQNADQLNSIDDYDIRARSQYSDASHPSLSAHDYEDKNSCVEGAQTPGIHTSQRHAAPLKLETAGLPDNGNHIETIAYHPDPSSPLTISKSEKNRESKLRKATKAILSLRRATSSLASHHGDNSSAGLSRSFRGFSYPKSLVSSFWRQNTADNSTCTRSARLDSLNSSNNWPQYANSPTCQNGGSQYDLSQKSHHRSEMDRESTSSSTFRLPQFIVPRMNALKLPIVCLIRSLDGELMREIFIHRYEVGQYLIDNLKVSLGIKDAKYFGLKLAKTVDEQEDVRQPWLDLNESVYKQISKYSKCISANADANNQQSTAATTKSVDIYLRIKFYPPNLARIQDQFLKKYLWLQLRRDLRLGKLTSSMNNLTFLMACALQFELEDFKNEYISEKLPEMNVLPNQDMIEQQAIEIWRTRLMGSKKHQIQMQFLRASVILETYGFDYYPVRDHQRQRAYLLGFNYAGVKTIRNGRIVHHFRWHSLGKITHERRMIIFHIYPSENSKRKQILGFKCLSNEDCLNLYMRLQEQKYFFTVDLTYFDKSLRRPSHLTESALDHSDQQQLSGWAGITETSNDQELDEYDPNDLGDGSVAQNQDPIGNQIRQESELNEQPVNHRESLLPGASGRVAFDGCDCASCRRDLHMHQQHQHSNNQSMDSNLSGHAPSYSSSSATPIARDALLMKSRSLQESNPCRSDAYNSSNCPTNFVSQSSSPGAFNERSDCCLNTSCGSPQILSSTMTNHYLGSETPMLQRQSSMLKYSPDFEMINEVTREHDVPGAAINAQDSCNVEGCVASWTEQVLTQSARIFSRRNWPAQQQEGRITRQASLNNQCVDNGLLMQGFFFCLLILALDLALRLSDGISSALGGLLAFSSAGHETTSHPSASCKPINDLGDLR